MPLRVNDQAIQRAARFFDPDLARRLSNGLVSHTDLAQARQILRTERAQGGWGQDQNRLFLAGELLHAVQAQHRAQHPDTTNREERRDRGEWAADEPRGWGARPYPPSYPPSYPYPPPLTEREQRRLGKELVIGGAALVMLGLIAKEINGGR